MLLKLILLLGFVWSIIPTFMYADYTYSRFGWFVELYLIGAYIRLYFSKTNVKKHLILVGFWGFIILIAEISVELLISKFPGAVALRHNGNYFIDMNTLPAVLFLIEVLLLFVSMKEFKIKLISTSALGIYLISENPYAKYYIWRNYFDIKIHWTSPTYWILIVSSVFCVFIGCMIIDAILWRFLLKNLVGCLID
jgi:hypothetical protein